MRKTKQQREMKKQANNRWETKEQKQQKTKQIKTTKQ